MAVLVMRVSHTETQQDEINRILRRPYENSLRYQRQRIDFRWQIKRLWHHIQRLCDAPLIKLSHICRTQSACIIPQSMKNPTYRLGSKFLFSFLRRSNENY